MSFWFRAFVSILPSGTYLCEAACEDINGDQDIGEETQLESGGCPSPSLTCSSDHKPSSGVICNICRQSIYTQHCCVPPQNHSSLQISASLSDPQGTLNLLSRKKILCLRFCSEGLSNFHMWKFPFSCLFLNCFLKKPVRWFCGQAAIVCQGVRRQSWFWTCSGQGRPICSWDSDEGKKVLCEGNNEGNRELWEIATSVLWKGGSGFLKTILWEPKDHFSSDCLMTSEKKKWTEFSMCIVALIVSDMCSCRDNVSVFLKPRWFNKNKTKQTNHCKTSKKNFLFYCLITINIQY